MLKNYYYSFGLKFQPGQQNEYSLVVENVNAISTSVCRYRIFFIKENTGFGFTVSLDLLVLIFSIFIVYVCTAELYWKQLLLTPFTHGIPVRRLASFNITYKKHMFFALHVFIDTEFLKMSLHKNHTLIC